MGKITSILVTVRHNEDIKNILAAISPQDDLNILGVENDEANALIKSENLKPDVLILDLSPPGMDAPDLAPLILRRSPSTSIIMMCDRDENDYVGKSLRAGISGFLLRKEDMNKLPPVVKIVDLGGYYISASIIARAINSTVFMNRSLDQFNYVKGYNFPSFSSAERGIISCIARGFSDEEIAKLLNFSTGTIKNCITAIKRKTNQKNRIQIVLFSLVYGLISLEQLDFVNFSSKIFPDRQFHNDRIQ